MEKNSNPNLVLKMGYLFGIFFLFIYTNTDKKENNERFIFIKLGIYILTYSLLSSVKILNKMQGHSAEIIGVTLKVEYTE